MEERKKEQPRWAMREEREPMASGQWAMREEEAHPAVRRQWAMREVEPPRRINEGEAPEAAGAEEAPSVQEYNPDDPRERRLQQLRNIYKGDIDRDMRESLQHHVEDVEPRQSPSEEESYERLERRTKPRSIFDEARGAK